MKKFSIPESVSEKKKPGDALRTEDAVGVAAEPDAATLDFLRCFARSCCPEPFVFARPSSEADYVLN